MATTKTATAPMKVAQIPKAGADFQIVEREIPKPGAGQVRIKVQACGVCHSDVLTKDGRGPAFSIRASQATKSPAPSMNQERVFPSGRWDNVLAPAGTGARTTHVRRAGAGISAIAGT